ncbi:hypothetical protein [Myceligenerans salitolerans]|uniref:Uncharacterized protein n=1 Tax=Myceligenerans salitolerans TaxID=1230528 RepID=A0ABS3IF53_9MICO|nr:hypothetical protein [Myceligenerans salitolerans]MBO0611098.1 hypothetical protein [Myceligenerans salitolerans]
MTTLSPLERAARAAYTRPDGSIPWERRTTRTRAYWRTIARRALDAALDVLELAAVLETHREAAPVPHPEAGHVDVCALCGIVGDIHAHQADKIRATILAPVVRIVPNNAPGRMYGEGYGGGWDDEGTAAEAARVARELQNRRQQQAEDEGEDQS